MWKMYGVLPRICFLPDSEAAADKTPRGLKKETLKQQWYARNLLYIWWCRISTDTERHAKASRGRKSRLICWLESKNLVQVRPEKTNLFCDKNKMSLNRRRASKWILMKVSENNQFSLRDRYHYNYNWCCGRWNLLLSASLTIAIWNCLIFVQFSGNGCNERPSFWCSTSIGLYCCRKTVHFLPFVGKATYYLLKILAFLYIPISMPLSSTSIPKCTRNGPQVYSSTSSGRKTGHFETLSGAFGDCLLERNKNHITSQTIIGDTRESLFYTLPDLKNRGLAVHEICPDGCVKTGKLQNDLN